MPETKAWSISVITPGHEHANACLITDDAGVRPGLFIELGGEQWHVSHRIARKPLGSSPLRHYYEPSQFGDWCALCGNAENATAHKR